MMTTNSAELKRELLDDDGENQAVRTFLQLYGQHGVTVLSMRRHLERSDFEGHWPDWVNDPANAGHLTKGGAQDWLRYLFALEGRTAAQGEQSKDDDPKWNADEICAACVNAGLGILEANSLIVTLKGASSKAGSAEQVSEREAEPVALKDLIVDVLHNHGWNGRLLDCNYAEAADDIIEAIDHRAALSAPGRNVMTDADFAMVKEWLDTLASHQLAGKADYAILEKLRALLNQQGEQTAPEVWITREEAFSMVTSGLPTADLIKQSFAMGAAFRMDQFKPDNLMTIAQSENVTAMRNALLNISRAIKAAAQAPRRRMEGWNEPAV